MKYNVSIVIVSLNNYNQLKDCLDSIKQHTHSVTYETLVVAYLFSEDNLALLKKNYPWVKIIGSNEIRGFSANNNLALKQALGEYCFVLNDDTFFDTPVVDQLYNRAITDDKIAILSPQILNPDKSIQFCGMGPSNATNWIASLYMIKTASPFKDKKWVKTSGFFQTYNILGAAFLIKTSIFAKLGFFDERYFFGPEDRALSTLINKSGYGCYIDSDIKLIHFGGSTGGKKTKTIRATKPSHTKGRIIFLSENNILKKYLLSTLVFINSALRSTAWMIKDMLGDKNARNIWIAELNVCKSVFDNKSTTETFKRFYKK